MRTVIGPQYRQGTAPNRSSRLWKSSAVGNFQPARDRGYGLRGILFGANNVPNQSFSSFPRKRTRKRESRAVGSQRLLWTPAFAGVTMSQVRKSLTLALMHTR